MSHIIERKKYAHGIVGEIVHDDGPTDGPHEWGNDCVLMSVHHRRYTNPAPECGRDPEATEDWAKDNQKTYAAFPLYMYDHGNTCYRVSEGGNPFSCPWDSGRVGFVFVKKSDFMRGKQWPSRKRLFKAAQSFCEEYTSWANGEVYGYIVRDEDHNELDSCWSFIGDIKYVIEAMDEAAAGYVEDAEERIASEMEDERPDMYAEPCGSADKLCDAASQNVEG